mmetsp:Transcript_21984/g.40186  ORF Transcript_21984/g.40186 Transcript_21984/m.40186 type:complete len:218 (-) Transcript_21984:315-968(-)
MPSAATIGHLRVAVCERQLVLDLCSEFFCVTFKACVGIQRQSRHASRQLHACRAHEPPHCVAADRCAICSASHAIIILVSATSFAPTSNVRVRVLLPFFAPLYGSPLVLLTIQLLKRLRERCLTDGARRLSLAHELSVRLFGRLFDLPLGRPVSLARQHHHFRHLARRSGSAAAPSHHGLKQREDSAEQKQSVGVVLLPSTRQRAVYKGYQDGVGVA